MITIMTATAQMRAEIHHFPDATPTITAGIEKMMGGMIKLVRMRIELYFGDSRFHSYAGGANSSSIAKLRLRGESIPAASKQAAYGRARGRCAAVQCEFLLVDFLPAHFLLALGP